MDIRKELKNTIYNTQHRIDVLADLLEHEKDWEKDDNDRISDVIQTVRIEERKNALDDLTRLLRLLETPELPAEKPKTPEQLEADYLKSMMAWKGNLGG